MTEHTQTSTCSSASSLAPPRRTATPAVPCFTVGDEDAEDVEEVAVYCPVCWEREFGGP